MKEDSQERKIFEQELKIHELQIYTIVIAIILSINFIATAYTMTKLDIATLKLEYHLTERK